MIDGKPMKLRFHLENILMEEVSAVLYFILKNGERLTIEENGEDVIFELFSVEGELMMEITYDSDSLSDMVFCE